MAARWATSAACALLAQAALAQVPAPPTVDPTAPQIEHPSETPLPEPRFERPGRAPLRLPPLQPLPRLPSLPGVPRVHVLSFHFTGNTVIGTGALERIAAPYTNRDLSNAELQELMHALTLYYVSRGYINSGAVLPDQDIGNGIIDIRIVEGRLTDILVEGLGRLGPRYVSERLALGAGPPLNVNALREQLHLILQSPLVERINADLVPGDNPGEAKLRAKVTEGPPIQVEGSFNNQLSPSLGSAQIELHATLYSPLRAGDLLDARVAYASGLKSLDTSWAVPLDAHDTTLTVHFDRALSEVVENPFRPLDIRSRTTTLGFTLSRPFLRTRQRQLVLSVGVERRNSKTFLLGIPFSFSPGVNNGESDVTVIRLAQAFTRRSPDRVLALRSSFNFGLHLLGATSNDTGPDGAFFSWLGQFQWAKRLDRGDELLLRADTQLTNNRLLPLEKFAVGGRHSVRGYRENLLVRDWGYSASIEYRVPIFRDASGHSTLRLAPFIDAGGARDINARTPEPRTLASIGLGLLWDPHRKMHAEIYFGHALVDARTPSNDLQDDGIHFSLTGFAF